MIENDLVSCGIRINGAGVFESHKQGVWNPPPLLKDYDLLIVTFGSGTCLINDKRYTMASRDVVLLRRGDRIKEPVTAGRLSNLFVHFDFIGPNGDPFDPPPHALPPRLSTSASLQLVIDLAEHIIRAHKRGHPRKGAAFLRAALLAIVDRPEPKRSAPGPQLCSRLIHDTASNVMADPARRRHVPDLAADAGMSTVLFSRLFRRYMGSAPGHFMIAARVKRAKMLLNSTSRSIAEIAEALGYTDEYHFSKQFKQSAGVPPAAYRRRRKPGNALVP